VVIGFCLIFLVTGIWRHRAAELKITDNGLRSYNDLEKNITLKGQVIGEPDIRANNIKLTIKPENIDEKILITANRYPEYQYGDRLKITGKLKTPPTLIFSRNGNYLPDAYFSVLFSQVVSYKISRRSSIYDSCCSSFYPTHFDL